MYIQRIGILSQTQAVAAHRPANCVKMEAASLMTPADNVFNVYSYTNSAFTICTWVKQLTANGNFAYITGRETSGAERTFQFYIYNSQKAPAFVFLTYDTDTLNVNTSANPQKEKWYFAAMTATKVSGGVLKKSFLFDESALVASGSTTTYNMLNSGNRRMLIGAARYASSQSAYYQCMNSFGVWNRISTSNEISAIWNSGNGMSYSDLSSGQKSGLVEWWNLDDWDGTKCVGSVSSIQAVQNNYGTSNISKVST